MTECTMEISKNVFVIHMGDPCGLIQILLLNSARISETWNEEEPAGSPRVD
jgi:hypothetical protein